jgi:hypothetical protein
MLGKSLIVMLLAGLVAGTAHGQGDPFYAVDTGLGAASASPGDSTFRLTQFQVARFTLPSRSTVVAIEGWIAYLSTLGPLSLAPHPRDPAEEASPVLTKRPKERSSGMIS